MVNETRAEVVAAIREELFAQTRTDPYALMVTRVYLEAWAGGYEQALRDHGLDDHVAPKPWSERLDDALEYLTDARRKSEVQFMLALAALGQKLAPFAPEQS